MQVSRLVPASASWKLGRAPQRNRPLRRTRMPAVVGVDDDDRSWSFVEDGGWGDGRVMDGDDAAGRSAADDGRTALRGSVRRWTRRI